MECIGQMRKFIRESIRSLLAEELDSSRHQKIMNHVNDCLLEFNKNVTRLAVENNHPYIRTYLTIALTKL